MDGHPWVVAYLIGVAFFLLLHEELSISASVVSSLKMLDEKTAKKVMWVVIFLWPVCLVGVVIQDLASWIRGEDPEDWLD